MAVRYGSNGNNNISGTEQADRLYGVGGRDTLTGRGGNDFIDGGSGDDTLDGGNGSDTIYAGSGTNRIEGGNGNDFLNGGSGIDRIYAGYGNDIVSGGAGNDFLHGRQGSDFMDGGSGSDQLFGGADTNDDRLYGSYGGDILVGEQGADYLDGWSRSSSPTLPPGERPLAEIDILRGNNLNGSADGYTDVFNLGTAEHRYNLAIDQGVFYSGTDQYAIIDDFAVGEDLINLSGETSIAWTEEDSSLGTETIPIVGVDDTHYYSEGALDTITGELSNYQYTNGVVEDLFHITLGPGFSTDSNFSATTVGGSNLDTILTLYDLAGNVVKTNDDSYGTAQSTIAVDGLTGDYLIGIKTFGSPVEGSYTIDLTGVKANVVAGYKVLDITDSSFLEDVISDFSYGSGIYHNNDLVAVLNNHSAGEFNLADASQFNYV